MGPDALGRVWGYDPAVAILEVGGRIDVSHGLPSESYPC